MTDAYGTSHVFLQSPRAVTVGAATATVGVTPPEVMIERANVAMMKLTGILKSKDKKA